MENTKLWKIIDTVLSFSRRKPFFSTILLKQSTKIWIKINPSIQFSISSVVRIEIQIKINLFLNDAARIIIKEILIFPFFTVDEGRRDSRRKRTRRLWITDSCNRCLVGPVLEESSAGTRALGRRHRSPSNVGGHGTSNIAGIESRRKWKINMYSTTSRCLVTSEEEEDSAGYSRATTLLSLGSLHHGVRVYSNWTFLMRKACSFHASFHGSNDCLFFVRIERRVANEGTERFDILRWWWVDSRSCIVIWMVIGAWEIFAWKSLKLKGRR